MESFGLEKYVEEHLTSAKNRFHLFKYKGLDDNTEEDVGIDTHIDRHFLTILCQNDVVDGLEIRAKDGEEWFKAKPSQDSSYLVMVGASLHVKSSFLESQVTQFDYLIDIYIIRMGFAGTVER